MANSSRLPFPTRTAPSSHNRLVTSASYVGTKSSSIRDEQVVAMPVVQRLSFSIIGTPVNARPSPEAIRASAFRACSKATSAVTVTKAFTFGSTRSMRSSTA